MQQIPPTWSPTSQPVATVPVRGAFLGSVLALGLFGNMIRGATQFLAAAAATGMAKSAQDSLDSSAAASFRHVAQVSNLLAVVALANVVFLVGAWMWKKWGALGCGAFMLLSSLYGFRESMLASMFGLLWLSILVGVVSSKWRYFE